MITNELNNRITRFVIERLNPVFAYLLDCTAQENIVEIAYFSDADMEEKQLYELEVSLSEEVGADVIINSLRHTDMEFISEVLQEWQLLYSADDVKKRLFEMALMRDLEKLDAEREKMLKRLKECNTLYIQ